MSADATGRSILSYVFVGVVDFICLLMAAESWHAGERRSAFEWLVAGVGSLVIGYYWPAIKQRLSPAPSKALPESGAVEPPVGAADVIIDYSHDDRDRSVTVAYSDARGAIQRGPNGITYQHTPGTSSRDRPILLRNITPGKNALNVRVQPLRNSAKQNSDKLIFRPDIITCIVGGEAAEVIPEFEFLKGGGGKNFKVNHLPSFLNDFYSAEGRMDVTEETLSEMFAEKSIWLEVHYESDGKQVVSECELLFMRWHEQIRTGQHKIRLASPVKENANGKTAAN
jgi:hypothetical protein